VKNDVLHRVKVERNTPNTTKRRKTNWMGHILCRNCLLKRIFKGNIEEGIEVTKDKGENVSSYGMTLRKGEGTVNSKRKQ
jgi:hypothetical protein